MTVFVVISAILPAIVLIFYIYREDKLQPEPKLQLVKGFGWGILSALVSLCLAAPLVALWGNNEPENFLDCVYTAFFGAAIPEECAKALCLYLFLRRNKYFDEYMDGIVYAVTIGMGFAGLENVLYLFNYIDDWVSVGISRAILSVPGHFFFAVLMGYFFSLWRIENNSNALMKMLLYPIMAHGIYDLLVFYMNVSESLASILFILFFFFLRQLRIKSSALIRNHLIEDTKEDKDYYTDVQ